ncbi:hypothetical protein V6N13_038616 [Hibiscus sabdariffa]
MESLEKAYIRIIHFGNMDCDRSAVRLLQGICNVWSLHLIVDGPGEPHLRTRLDSMLAFHYLFELEFTDPYRCWKGTWIVEFLDCTPNLERLVLD